MAYLLSDDEFAWTGTAVLLTVGNILRALSTGNLKALTRRLRASRSESKYLLCTDFGGWTRHQQTVLMTGCSAMSRKALWTLGRMVDMFLSM